LEDSKAKSKTGRVAIVAALFMITSSNLAEALHRTCVIGSTTKGLERERHAQERLRERTLQNPLHGKSKRLGVLFSFTCNVLSNSKIFLREFLKQDSLAICFSKRYNKYIYKYENGSQLTTSPYL
jgi:hypothetical protein